MKEGIFWLYVLPAPAPLPLLSSHVGPRSGARPLFPSAFVPYLDARFSLPVNSQRSSTVF